MRSIAACVALTLLGAVPSLHAQRTLVVDSNNGPYRTIQSAVDAAAVGDIVLVRRGTYQGALITKGLQLLNTPGVGVTISTELVIKNIKQGERVAIKGFRMEGTGKRSVQCSNCVGTVHLEGIDGGGRIAARVCWS